MKRPNRPSIMTKEVHSEIINSRFFGIYTQTFEHEELAQLIATDYFGMGRVFDIYYPRSASPAEKRILKTLSNWVLRECNYKWDCR